MRKEHPPIVCARPGCGAVRPKTYREAIGWAGFSLAMAHADGKDQWSHSHYCAACAPLVVDLLLERGIIKLGQVGRGEPIRNCTHIRQVTRHGKPMPCATPDCAHTTPEGGQAYRSEDAIYRRQAIVGGLSGTQYYWDLIPT